MIRSLILILGAAAVSTAFAQTTTTPTSREFTFPPAGLGATETAEISVVNAASNSSNGTAASCTGTILFLNAAGATIGSATPFTVTSGQISVARLPFASSGGTGTRAEIRGAVTLTASTVSPRPPCDLEFSFQTFDTASGATHLLLTGAAQQGGGGH